MAKVAFRVVGFQCFFCDLIHAFWRTDFIYKHPKIGYDLCNKCGFVKPISEFVQCGYCIHCYHIMHKRWRNKDRDEVIKLLGGKCDICGMTDERVFCVHHIDGRDYPNGFKKETGSQGWSRYLKEYKAGVRLQLLCMNCHTILDDRRKPSIAVMTKDQESHQDYREGYELKEYPYRSASMTKHKHDILAFLSSYDNGFRRKDLKDHFGHDVTHRTVDALIRDGLVERVKTDRRHSFIKLTELGFKTLFP